MSATLLPDQHRSDEPIVATSSPFDMLQWLPAHARETFDRTAYRRSYADGNRIYVQSEAGTEMFRLLSGSVRLSVLRDDGREVLYLIFEPGDCFGSSSLVDGGPRPQTASAQGAVEVQVLQREAFERLRVAYPCFNDAIARLICRHLRLLSEYFVSSTLDQLSSRVARRLLEASKSFGVRTDRGVRLNMRLPQSELALMVGASRQAVNKVLQGFQEEGLVTIEHGTWLIHDTVRLRHLIADL